MKHKWHTGLEHLMKETDCICLIPCYQNKVTEKELYPRQRTNVILMTMCYNNCLNFVTPFFDKGSIRYNFLDTKLVVAVMEVQEWSRVSASENNRRKLNKRKLHKRLKNTINEKITAKLMPSKNFNSGKDHGMKGFDSTFTRDLARFCTYWLPCLSNAQLRLCDA